jgi:uncharacterized damage-inducible protein DinB
MPSPGEQLAKYASAVRDSSLKRLRRVPVGHENWSPSKNALSFADLAHHLVAADEWLFEKLEDPSLRGMVARAGEAGQVSHSEFEETLARLEQSGVRRAELLASLDAASLERALPDDRFGGEVTLWWLVVRGNLDHEAHHRGQIATYLRILADSGESSG